MRGAGDGAVDAVGRERGEVVLLRRPSPAAEPVPAVTTARGRLPRLVSFAASVELGRHVGDVADELARLLGRLAVLGIEEEVAEPGARQRRQDGEERVHAGERLDWRGCIESSRTTPATCAG